MSGNEFTTVRVVGGLVPTDVLGRILAGDKELGGLTSADYHLASGESAREAANRAWPYLLGAWQNYRQALAKLPEGDAAVGLTREKWLTLLFKELDFGRLHPTPAGGIVIDDKTFPVSHIWGATPLHLLGWGVALDKRNKGVPGAADRAPQAMLQELLNRTDDYLWAMLSNGRTIRLLRDSTSLAGQAYVEFDLESMFDGEVFSDFVLLYLLLHQSRVEVPTEGIPADCWLEKWRTAATESGTRALGLLRDGVEEAIEALGTGFLQTQGNGLNARLADGTLRIEDYHRSLLRLIYRLLFLFVAEDRGLLHPPNSDPKSVQRYRDYYSTSRLRDLARKRRGSRHTDLYDGLKLTLHGLATNGGRPELALPGLGGIFTDEPIDVVSDADLPNQALLTALRKLSIVHPKGSPPRTVDYRNLGAEELGSIYESLLELVPRHDQLDRTFTLELLAGNDRRTSGSYYTPTSLIDLVLDEALDPILDEREREMDPEQALLDITVCDPACGSGHFLVAAARRIATRVAAVRTGEADPTPTAVQHALHDVVARCIYGVDLNPMAAELAKVSLWLEAMEPGQPLSFLDAHIKVGNALLGTTPRLIAEGIPDAAFDPIEGDDKKYASSLKKRNKQEREQSIGGSHQSGLFDDASIDVSNAHLRQQYQEAVAESLQATSLTQLAAAEKRYREAQDAPEARRARLVADTWSAAFVQHQVPGAISITHTTVEQAAIASLTAEAEAEVDQLAASFGFFHWHLEFPDVFPVPAGEPTNADNGWDGGFTIMLGNPPWERVKLQEQEFFASRDERIAKAKNAAARKKLIAALSTQQPVLGQEWTAAKREAEGRSHFLRQSGRYPLCGKGDVNTYSVFAELFRSSIEYSGRMGIITPTGLATDATTADFLADTLRSQRLVAFYDFVNRQGLFSNVAGLMRFAVSVLAGGRPVMDSSLAFLCLSPADVPSRRFSLKAGEVLALNPNTGTLPVFATKRDADITIGIYRRHPVLIREGDPDGNPWGLSFATMFHMANDSGLFHTADDLTDFGAAFDGWAWAKGEKKWLPLYEAKMLHIYDDRFGTYAGTALEDGKGVRAIPTPTDAQHDDPNFAVRARYWVSETEVEKAIGTRSETGWLLGWRKITYAEHVRTFVTSAMPRAAVGDAFTLAYVAAEFAELQAIWSSLVFDFVSRQKISGTNMTYGVVAQLAFPIPEVFRVMPSWLSVSLSDWIIVRSKELVYTSYRIASFARDLGDQGLPFRWLPERRETIRAELDAAMMHVYGLQRDEVEHVLDSFLVLRKYEERDYGEFRTKRLVLAEYDRMAEAATTGVSYESTLNPPPGFGPRHDASTIPDWFQE
ncbi:N-6 DNA methylase [Actinomycetota bacterium]|nr:N-6 DNA methylase [Actinomycetota bacterium]